MYQALYMYYFIQTKTTEGGRIIHKGRIVMEEGLNPGISDSRALAFHHYTISLPIFLAHKILTKTADF